MRGLKDKTAIVTGSGGGIGRQIALRLSDEGATVAVNDIDEEKAMGTVEEIRDRGGKASAAVADVTELEEVRTMVSGVVEEHEGVDILVNNAGWDEIEWFLDQDPEVWDRIIDINLKGQINCSRAVAEVMVERQTEGKIINISSDAGRVGSSGEAVYSGAKGGIISFTKTLARELARYEINCNAVAPGPTDTPLTRRMREDSELGKKIFEGMRKQIPFGRMAEPKDIAGAVVFMASEDADYITGQVLSVSGGLTMVG